MSRRVLLVKTSSLGDVVHLLSAVSEAVRARPELRFDWLVEPAFAEVPAWHDAVDEVFAVPVRSWRRAPAAAFPALRALRARLAARRYEHVIDAQGLVKSAVLARLAAGHRVGFDRASAREPLAALAYQQGVAVPRQLHAVERCRRLLGAALGYEVAAAPVPASGIEAPRDAGDHGDAVWLLPSTTWVNKHWPDAHWSELAATLAADGFAVRVPWGAARDAERAERIAEAGRGVAIAPTSLTALRDGLAGARAVVGVDTGPLHIAAALGVPVLALHGPTDIARTGPMGPRALGPCRPACLRTVRSPGVHEQ